MPSERNRFLVTYRVIRPDGSLFVEYNDYPISTSNILSYINRLKKRYKAKGYHVDLVRVIGESRREVIL